MLGAEPTWTQDLNAIGRKLFGAAFLGAFAPNQQPRKPKPGQMWIWNTNATTGEHWGATGVLPDGKRLSFDSYGRNNRLVHTRKGMKRRDYQSWTDSDAEQSKESAICGPLSLAWLTIFRDDPETAKQI